LTVEPKIKKAAEHLKRRDPVLADLIERVGPCTLHRCRSYFQTLVDSIVWQQLSWKAACAIQQRMLTVLRTRRPEPRDFLALSEEDLMTAGLSRQKCRYLKEVAELFASRRFASRRIRRLDDEEVIELLTAIKGVGRWTADMFLIFGLNRLDVFPVGDLALRKAIYNHYTKRTPVDECELRAIADDWRPFRTVATWYLWKSSDGAPVTSGP